MDNSLNYKDLNNREINIIHIPLDKKFISEYIYQSFEKFIDSLKLDNWIILFIFFELNLIKELGYDSNLSQFINETPSQSGIKKIKIDNINYDIPEYLILKKIPKIIDKKIVKISLNFTRSIIQNKFFTPNNLTFPKSRILLENYFS